MSKREIAVRVGVGEHAVAAARQHPRHGRAVALRDPSGGEHLGRAIGAGVASVGAELNGAATLVELGTVPRAQTDEPLVGAPIPVEGEFQRLARSAVRLRVSTLIGVQRDA